MVLDGQRTGVRRGQCRSVATKWDEPALIDAAKLSCLGGKFKPESHTCQALQMM